METVERIRHFDYYQASVDISFRNPQVQASLGRLATDILAVNERVFLPTIKGNEIGIPRAYVDDFCATALIPMEDAEARRAYTYINPLTATHGPKRALDEYSTSIVTGLSISTDFLIGESLRSHSQSATRYQSSSTPEGLKERSSARTAAHFKLWGDRLEGYSIETSRPVVTVKASHLQGYNHINTAASIGHEYVHVLDVLGNALLYWWPHGGAASELAAYKVSDTLYKLSDQPATGARFTSEVEAWRAANTTPDRPFIPRWQDVDSLKGWIID